MTRDEILNMPAGREMDALIAEKMMGYINGRKDHTYPDGSGNWWTTHIPHYSTDIAAAWEVVNALENKDIWFELSNVIPNSDAIVYEVRFGSEYVCEETAPLAICRAALLAVIEVQP